MDTPPSIDGPTPREAQAPEAAAASEGPAPALVVTAPRSYAKPLAAGGVALTYAAFSTWAYFAWFRGKQSRGIGPTIDGFGVDTYAGGADKLGHAWASYALSRGTTALLVHAGWQRLGSSIVSAGLSQFFFTWSEYEDSFVYQLEISDLIANVTGAALAVLMDNAPALDRLLDFRLEYFPSADYRRTVREDGNIDVAQDYSGQSYLLALHLGAVPGLTAPAALRWAGYVDVVAGFETRHYLPVPEPAVAPTQRLYLGIALDVQAVLRAAFCDSTGRRIAHGVAEYVSVPFTTWKALDATRSR